MYEPHVLEVLGGFKPIPDEEGTETSLSCDKEPRRNGFKPIPDEEGTETS